MSPSQDPKSGSDGGGLPTWLPTSFEGFQNLVVGAVVVWIVGAIVSVWESLIAATMAVWDSILSIGGTLGDVLETGASLAASVPVAALGILEELVVGLAESAGPAAPLVVVVVFSVGIVVLVATARALIRATGWAYRMVPLT